jgi:erythromycin esterase
MQYPQRAARLALEYVARVDPAGAARLTPSLAVLQSPIDSGDLSVAAPEEKRAASAAAAALVRRFDDERATWTARSSDAEWALARQHAHLLEQYCAMIAPDASTKVRDVAMADNVDWILAHEPKAKIVLWAHNLHIGADHMHGLITMGGELRRRWRKSYVNLAFAFDHGGFRALDPDRSGPPQSFDLPPAPAGSLDHTLAETGLPRLILDLRSRPSTGIVANWFNAMHKHRDYGAVFSAKWPTAEGEDFILPRQFDLVAFVAATSPSRSLWPATERSSSTLPEPRNLGFEELDDGQPRDWTFSSLSDRFGWSITASTERPFAGRRCLLIRSLPTRVGEMEAKVSQKLSVERYRGKRVRLSAAVRANLSSGDARLFVDSIVGTIPPQGAVDRMRARPIKSPRWTRYSIEMDVPSVVGNAAAQPTLTIGAALWGQGAACFDDFKLEVVR